VAHAVWTARGLLAEVVAAYAREEGPMSIPCAICGEACWPTGRWREDCCTDCFARNFAASQELRIDPPPSSLTDRQRAALQGPAWYVTQARAAAHERDEVACREAMQQRLAQEDTD
jgi:hypothetical protein